MSKVKYRSFRKSEETLWRSSLPENEVEKPINWSNTPEGYYYIRGNKQGHYKDYIYIDNKWYLLNDQRKENGQWVYKCTEEELFQFDLLYKAFGVQTETGETVYPEKVEIFGEGYGLKIQKGGNYIKDHCDFILFDVRILTSTGESLWLTREACEDIAKKLNLKIVPLVGYMTIKEAEDFVKAGFKSLIAENKDYIAEGLVLKAPCGLLNRRGKRIITKIKYCNYKDL